MNSDDEYDHYEASEERIKALGFKPQREMVINNLLPYADKLDKESAELLDQIKTNFAKSIILREMKPACGVWSARLMKYLRLYGLKFSKEDHIALIKLVYELIFIPDLEPSKIHKFATIFTMLTKKRYLLSPNELVLPWRPLFDMGVKVFYKSRTHIGMYHYLTPPSKNNKSGMISFIRSILSGSVLEDALDYYGFAPKEDEMSLESSFITMVKCAKPYFELSATKEILDECLPHIVPWSSEDNLLAPMVSFLPVALAPEHAAIGHELWFDELMTLWDTCYNSPCGMSELMLLFSSLAKRNPGAVDWTPHVPKMFSRFLHALNLPVSYKDMQYTRNHSLEIKCMASWIVWTIRPDGLVLKHLSSFLSSVESYLHSANSGRWSFKLRDLLRKLSKEFLNRIRREREKKFLKSWENKTPNHYKLREEDITEFVTIVLDPTILAVYSRNGSVDVAIALQNLATLRPALVIPPLLERLTTALESLTEPHRVTAAMTTVAAVARPLLRGADNGFPAGVTHVVPLLMAVLPGLDPNDMKKTLVSLHFILVFSWMVPFIDCSSAADHWEDLTEEELLACESTAHFEDFVLLFMERIFSLVESSVLENVRLDTDREVDSARSKAESVMETALSSAAISVLMQCSPQIFNEALRKFKNFAMTTTFETNVAGSIMGVLLRVFARVDAETTLNLFIPELCQELNDLLISDETLKDENPSRELQYRLLLLSQVIHNGKAITPFIPQITSVLDRALKMHARDALVRACDILGHTMSSLSVPELTEFRSCSKDYSKAPKEWLPVREWGRGCSIKDAKFVWQTPTEVEVNIAQNLLNRYMKPEIERLEQWLSGQRDMCRKRRLRSFYIINATTSCPKFLPQPDEPPVLLIESAVPATSFPLVSNTRYSINLDGENTRVALTKLLMRVQKRMIEDKSDDTKGFELLVQAWERISGIKSSTVGPSLEVRMRSYAALERTLDGKGGPTPGGGRMRTLLADAVKLQEESRNDLQNDAGIGETGLCVLEALYQLSIYSYTSVRIQSQARLYWMLSHYAYSYRYLLPKLISLLTVGGSGEEWHAQHKGGLYMMLGPRVAPLLAKQDWEVVRALWPAVLKAPLSEKPSIMRLEQAFSDTLHRQFPTVNTKLTLPQSCIEASKYFLKETLLDDEFNKLLAKAEENERITSDKNERLYTELVEELVDIAEAPNVPWRRLELVMQLLTFCPSLQTPYPPKAVKFIVESLIHDNISVRKMAIKLTHLALKQRKHKVKKITADPYEIAGVSKPEKRVPGYRKDNEWALWSEDRVPTTDEEWEKPWLRKSTVGFYAWPDKLEVAAPSTEQVSPDRSPDTMELGERHLFDFFSDDTKVDKLVSFLIEEEKKGKDKFNGSRFSMFRVLFRCFGARVGDKFLKLALHHASSTQEAPQRFAAEIVAAALRAPRYWVRESANAFYAKAIEVLKIGLSSVTPESLEDWGTCVASALEDMCPLRGGSVVSSLVDTCAPQPTPGEDSQEQGTSFVICARLYALQGALGTLSWRVAPLASKLLDQLETARFIQHPYQNVRESVGSILMTIFDTEISFPGGDAGPAPRIAEFLERIKPQLAALYDENGEIIIKTSSCLTSPACATSSPAVCSPEPALRRGDNIVPISVARLSPGVESDEKGQGGNDNQDVSESEPVEIIERSKSLADRLDTALRLSGDVAPVGPKEHARAVNLLTTVLRSCMGVIVRGVNGATPSQYELMRIGCALSARGPPQPHDELGRAADGFLASLAMSNHTDESIDIALLAIEDVAKNKSWWARLACVEFAQPLLFYGLPLLRAQPQRAVRAEIFALQLMKDSRLEVRKAASKLLTGLMHCQALPNEDQTIKKLIKNCHKKDIVERHCGVLGLCAYLSSKPYTIGSKIGVVLAELSRHTNAPDPIPATIRTALADFRRTHQDDWPKHRQTLTEEELDLLDDLTSPPSYCA